MFSVPRHHVHYDDRLQSRSLESQMAGLQSLWLASRLNPWLRIIDGLWWLMAASHDLWVQTKKNNRGKLAVTSIYLKCQIQHRK